MSTEVLVAGVGMIPFAKPGASMAYHEMGAAAIRAALGDAGLAYPDAQQVYAGYVYGDSTSGQRAAYVHLFLEAAVLVAPHIALVALVRLDQFALAGHGSSPPSCVRLPTAPLEAAFRGAAGDQAAAQTKAAADARSAAARFSSGVGRRQNVSWLRSATAL